MKRTPFSSGILVPFFLFVNLHLQGVNNLRLPDIRSIGMGGNGVTQTVLINPALLPLAVDKSLSLHYYNRYGLKELGTGAANFIYPTRFLSAGLQLSSFGYDAYRESRIGFSLGKQIDRRWTLGVGVHYLLLQTMLHDEQPSQLSVDTGVTFRASDYFRWGLACLNLPTISLGDKAYDSSLHLSYSLQMGFSWMILENMMITGTLITNEQQSLSAEAGIEYAVFNSFYLRSGICTSPLLPSFGIGYTYSLFTVDAAVVSHPLLGVNTGIGLTITF